MEHSTNQERIVVSRTICHGQTRIAGTRVMVHQVLDLLAAGMTPAIIASDEYFPDISEQDVLACVAYASRIIQDESIVPVVA